MTKKVIPFLFILMEFCDALLPSIYNLEASMKLKYFYDILKGLKGERWKGRGEGDDEGERRQ